MSARFDRVVVERLMAGIPTAIHPDERAATARELVRRGMGRDEAGHVCGMSGTTLASVVAA